MKLVKFVVEKGIKVKAYEEQGILEDGDSDYRDGADGTGNYAGGCQLYVRKWGESLVVRSFFYTFAEKKKRRWKISRYSQCDRYQVPVTCINASYVQRGRNGVSCF